jgi:hypothetical protein
MGTTVRVLRRSSAALLALVVMGCSPPPEGSGGGGTSSTSSTTVASWEPQLVTTESTLDLTCRAGSLGGVRAGTFAETYRVEAPVDVPEGVSFDIVLRPPLFEVPTVHGGAGIGKMNGFRNAYRLPAGVTVDAVVEEPSPGSSLVGYYVAPGADRSDTTTHQPVPGGTQVSYDAATRTLSTSLPGTGTLTSTTGELRAGSAVQPPHIRLTVTALAAAGTELVTEVGGSLPADPDVLPWSDPSIVRNDVSTLLTLPPNSHWFCAPFPDTDISLSTTTVISE